MASVVALCKFMPWHLGSDGVGVGVWHFDARHIAQRKDMGVAQHPQHLVCRRCTLHHTASPPGVGGVGLGGRSHKG